MTDYTNNQSDDLLKEIEEKRTKRLAQQLKKDTKKPHSFLSKEDRVEIKRALLLGLYALGVIASVVCATNYACQKIEERAVASSQNHIRDVLNRIDPEIKNRIRRDYDGELIMLINQYQSGEKLNGFKMSPRGAVFSAHSELLYKYDAYNPDAQDDKRTLEDWILLDHISYRYYQYKEMELSNTRGETNNPYLDMLRTEFASPIIERVPVQHDNFFEGLKLDNVMKR